MSNSFRSATVVFAFFLSVSAAAAVAPARTKVALLLSFTSPITSHVLTDLNLEKGYKVFVQMNPEFEKQLDITPYDNQGEPKNIPGLVGQIVQSKTKFILGLSKTSQALVAAPLSDQNGFFMLTPLATNDKVTEGHPLVARTCFSDSHQAKTLGRFALEELKAKRILLLTNVDSPYSVDLSKTFSTIVGVKAQMTELKYSGDDMRTSELHKQIDEFKPDLVFIPDYVNTASLLIKEIYKKQPKLTLLGADGWGGREVLDPTIKPLSELNAYYTTIWNHALTTKENLAFVKAHQKVFPGETVSTGAATMYDSLSVFWKAFRTAKPPKTPESVRAQLLTGTFPTTTGPIRYADAKDLTPTRKVVIIRLNAGKHELYKSF